MNDSRGFSCSFFSTVNVSLLNALEFEYWDWMLLSTDKIFGINSPDPGEESEWDFSEKKKKISTTRGTFWSVSSFMFKYIPIIDRWTLLFHLCEVDGVIISDFGQFYSACMTSSKQFIFALQTKKIIIFDFKLDWVQWQPYRIQVPAKNLRHINKPKSTFGIRVLKERCVFFSGSINNQFRVTDIHWKKNI